MRSSASLWSSAITAAAASHGSCTSVAGALNRKKVQRLMRKDNLLCLRKRRFVVTTDSNHPLPVYPNLARDMVLTGINQLWRADITYVRLETEFVYLAVVLDAFSRKVVGWALDRTL